MSYTKAYKRDLINKIYSTRTVMATVENFLSKII